MRRRVSGRLVRVLVAGALLALAGCGSPSATPAPAASSSSTSVPSPAAASASAPVSAPEPSSLASDAISPLVAAATWVRGSGGRSLHIVPTAAGRAAQGAGDAARAWAEVLRLAPDADQPGMQAQFDCHWTYARLVQPGKPSWNVEPWRPVVSDVQMVAARCNPGGPESADG